MTPLPLVVAVVALQPHFATPSCARRRAVELAAGAAAAAVSGPSLAAAQQQLTFTTTASGLRWADIVAGSGEEVGPGSRVIFHVVGRLVGRQGWVFLNTQASEEEPYRQVVGSGDMIDGLDEGLRGMRARGTRRLIIPSPLGYKDRTREPKPRGFGQQQRLYTTVLNANRLSQEAEGLGAGNDVAGVVALDVRLLSVRPPQETASLPLALRRSDAWNALVPSALAAPVDPAALLRAPGRSSELGLAENTQIASALVLPLLAYKLSAMVQGVKLQWYLDATIALVVASLVVFASKS